MPATRDRCADLEPRLRARRLDFEDDAEVTARLPRRAFDVVSMRSVLACTTDERAASARVRGLPSPAGCGR